MNFDKREGLRLIAIKEFQEYSDMYKIVDFLNKNLKSTGLIFGLTRKDGKDTIAIYNSCEVKNNE